MLSLIRNFSTFLLDLHFRGGRGVGLAVACLMLFFFVVSSSEIFLGLGFLGAIFFVGLIGIPLVSLIDRKNGVPALCLKMSLVRLKQISRAFVRVFRILFLRVDCRSLLLLQKNKWQEGLVFLSSCPRLPHVSLSPKLLPAPEFSLTA